MDRPRGDVGDWGPVPLLLLGLFAVPTVSWFTASTEEVFSRLAAGILELLGVGMVGWGFYQARLRAGGQPLRAVARDRISDGVRYLRDHPWLAWLFPRKPESQVLDVHNSVIGTTVDQIDLQVKPPPGLEGRVRHLENQAGLLRRQVLELQSDGRELREDVDTERDERKREIERLEALLHQVPVEGMGLEVVGLAWVAGGLTIQTWPDAAVAVARVFLGWLGGAPG